MLTVFNAGLDKLLLEGNAVFVLNYPLCLTDTQMQAVGKLGQRWRFSGQVGEKFIQHIDVVFLRDGCLIAG